MAINKNTTKSKHVFFKRSGDKKKVLKPRKKASSLIPDIKLEDFGHTIKLLDNQVDQENHQSIIKPNPKIDPEKDEIKRTIEESVSRLSRINDEIASDEEQEMIKETPQEFNGVDSEEEKETLHNAEAVSYQKKAAKLAHEIDILKNEFEAEKKHLEHTVRELKKELHRTAPIQDNKFFSLSKQLRSSLEEIETLVDPTIKPEDISRILMSDTSTQPPVDNQNATSTVVPEIKTISLPPIQTQPLPQPHQVTQEKPAEPPKQPEQEHKPKKHIEKKLLITAISLLFVLSSGGVVSYNLIKKPEVDQTLVNNYLENQGQIQGATTGRQPKIDRYAEVSFDASEWVSFNDPIYGIAFQYPGNVVEKQKNGNGIAFLRKDGFLFKFQEIITPDTLKQYWDKNQDGGEMYIVEEVKFKGRDAISLVLKEKSEYSGNRYLVKVGDGILDIWYTTDDTHFNEDDIKRTQKIVDSISFIE